MTIVVYILRHIYSASQNSIIRNFQKMFENFYNKYIDINLKDYFDVAFDFKINKVLFFAFLGLVVACIIINYVESGISLMLKRLMRTETYSEECAKTLKDLGLKDSRAVRVSLRRRGGLSARLILTAGERQMTYEEYIAREKKRKDEKKTHRRDRFLSIFGKKSKSDGECSESNPESTVLDAADEKCDVGVPNSTSSTSDTATEKPDDNANERASAITTQATAQTISDNTPEDTANAASENAAESVGVSVVTNDKTDLNTARFYIPEDMRDLAQRYLERRNPTVTKTVLSCVAIMVFYVAIALFMPTLIDIVKAIST